MNIKAKIDRMVGEDSKIKAYASLNLDDAVVIKDVAVMDGKNGLFARMPYRSYTDKNGAKQYADTVFGLTEEARKSINDAVVSAYEQGLSETQVQEMDAPDEETSGPTMTM